MTRKYDPDGNLLPGLGKPDKICCSENPEYYLTRSAVSEYQAIANLAALVQGDPFLNGSFQDTATAHLERVLKDATLYGINESITVSSLELEDSVDLEYTGLKEMATLVGENPFENSMFETAATIYLRKALEQARTRGIEISRKIKAASVL